MKTMKYSTVFLLASILALNACRDKPKEEPVSPEPVPVAETVYETFTLYGTKDSLFAIDGLIRMVAVAEQELPLDQSLSIGQKLETLLDSLSARHFNGLEIAVRQVEENGDSLIAHIDLRERPDYSGPGSLPLFQAWYDYFQGSYGGSQTSLILQETVMQRDFSGPWIDAAVFYYRGQPMDMMDHLDLSGVIPRYPA